MNMLSLLPVFLLGIVTVWFLWPMVMDPLMRRRSVPAGTREEKRSDDLFRALAAHSGPKHHRFSTDGR